MVAQQDFPEEFAPFAGGGLPTRETCDLDDPYQMFLWCFVALPMVQGAPLIMPIDYYQLVSKRLYDLGVRLVEEPTLEYVPPQWNDPNVWYAPGDWKPIE